MARTEEHLSSQTWSRPGFGDELSHLCSFVKSKLMTETARLEVTRDSTVLFDSRVIWTLYKDGGQSHTLFSVWQGLGVRERSVLESQVLKCKIVNCK